MPVYRLTSNYIWNSFQNSHKKHIIITGNRGIGKTTILNSLFPNVLPGITTWAVPQKCVYLKDNESDEVTQVGVFNPNRGNFENKMEIHHNGFNTLGIKTLKKAIQSDSKWVRIDEIGYLESHSTQYLEMISEVMKHKQLVAVVRKQNLKHLKELCERDDVFLIDLDEPFQKIGCIIMASGLGKRFGENKLIKEFHGKPLISYILEATANLFSRRVVVTRHEEVANICRRQNVDVILHDLPYRNNTIRLGLETLLDTTHCMFCTGDQPLLTQETIAALTLATINEPTKIVRPICDNSVGSPVIFPQSTYDELLQIPQGKGGGYVIKQRPELVQYLPIKDPNELKDIDTKEDFDTLQSIKKHKP